MVCALWTLPIRFCYNINYYIFMQMPLPSIYGYNRTSLAVVIKGYCNELSGAILLANLAGQWFMLIPTDSM